VKRLGYRARGLCGKIERPLNDRSSAVSPGRGGRKKGRVADAWRGRSGGNCAVTGELIWNNRDQGKFVATTDRLLPPQVPDRGPKWVARGGGDCRVR